MLLSTLMALHVLGIVLWLGGAHCAGLVLLKLRDSKNPALEALAKTFLFKLCHPGMALTLAAGAGMFSFNPGHYGSQGWIWAKLLFALGPVASAILLTKAYKTVLARPSSIGRTSLIAYLIGLWGSVAAVFLLAFIRPF